MHLSQCSEGFELASAASAATGNSVGVQPKIGCADPPSSRSRVKEI